MKRAKKGKKAKSVGEFLEPITSKLKQKKFAVFDIESKDGDTNKGGFERPFAVGFYDPFFREPKRKKKFVAATSTRDKDHGPYLEFWNEPHLEGRHWQERAIAPGGCLDKLMNVVLQPKYSGYAIYSHNGGNFDELHILPWLQAHRDEYEHEVIPIQSTIQVLRVWRRPDEPEDDIQHTWDFLDSMKLIPTSLADACKAFHVTNADGTEVGKLEIDYDEPEDHPDWSVYLKQDCVALAMVMSKFYSMVQDRLGGEVGITTASTSVKLYRRAFMKPEYGVPDKIPRWRHWDHCDKKKTCAGCFHEWVRLAYHGGRTEIYQLEGKNIRYFDINSSYVATMQEEMPIGERIVHHGKLDWRMHRSPDNPDGAYSGFCECLVYIPPSCPIPPLPHYSDERGKLIFPTGYLYGVWSVEELALLSDPFVNGKILNVVKTVWFRLQPMFGAMVQQLWKLRDKSIPGYDEGLSALAKLLGNSAYGKFAMKQERTSVVWRKDVATCPRCDKLVRTTRDDGKLVCDSCHIEVKQDMCWLCAEPADVPGGLCLECEGSKPTSNDPDGELWYRSHKVDATYIIPHVPAHITAQARVRLWRGMKTAVSLGGNIYYVDTDSILTDVDLPCSSKLGDFKNEYPGQLLEYFAVQPKVYVIKTMDGAQLGSKGKKDHKVTMKGFPKNQRTMENVRTLQRREADLCIEWRQLEKVRTLAGLNFVRPPQMKDVKKSFKSEYDKRQIIEGTANTRPIMIDERETFYAIMKTHNSLATNYTYEDVPSLFGGP